MESAEQRQVRRLAAIAVLDVVGYSRLMAEGEDGTLAVLQAHRNELDPVLRNHGARIVKGTGDGMLVEVASAVEAVKAANHEAANLLSRCALALGRHSPLALTAASQVKTWRGDPQAAIPLLSDAWRLARYEPWRYHIATNLAFSHYLDSGYEAAWAWARRGLEASDYLQQRLVGAAALAQLGRTGEANEQIQFVLQRSPTVSVDAIRRNLKWEHQEDIDHYCAGLEKAGLPS